MTNIVKFDQRAIDAKRELIARAQEAAQALVVNTPEQAADAAEFLADVQEEAKAIEAMRKSATDPILASLETIRGWFRPVETGLKLVETTVKERIGEYAAAAKEEQRKAFAAAAELHKAGDHTQARALVAVSNDAAGKRSPKGTNTREVWEAKVTDASQVPREWCVPDEKRIKASAKSVHADQQPPPIPGVVYTRKVVVVGRKRTP